MSGNSLALPLSILAGCALIALAVYFGLKTPPAKGVGPAAAPYTDVDAEARRAVDAQKPQLVLACLTTAKPGPIHLTLELTFGADGRQLARGMMEERGASQPEVTACVGQKLLPLQIPPPGATVSVRVPLELR